MRTSGPKSRAAATAAEKAIRPGSRSSTSPDAWSSARREVSAAPPASDATTIASATTAATSTRPEAPPGLRGHGGGDRDHRRGEHDHSDCDREPRGREDALAENGPDRRTGALCNHDGHAEAEEPPDERSGARHERALDDRQQSQVPAPRAVPREAPPGRLQITAHTSRCQNGEREEQCGRLPANEQQPATRHGCRPFRCPKLLHRRLHAVADRPRRQSRASAFAPPDEVVDLP